MEPYLSLNFGADRARRLHGMQDIVDAIAAELAAGRVLTGCRLPPIRALALQLGVSKNTVTAAYEELKAKGIVESRDRRGLFVAAPEGSRAPFATLAARAPRVPLKPMHPVSRAVTGAKGALTLGSVFIDPRLLPREKLEACFRSVLRTPGLASFASLEGFPPLRRAIAARLKKRGIDADPDHIVTTVGSQQVLDIVCRSLGSKVVATENPAYYVGKALFEMNGLDVVALDVNPFTGIDLAAWDRELAARKPGLAYLTTNFQNPTGYSYTTGELAGILALARHHGFGLLEDDWGSDMLSYTEVKPSLRALGGSNVLYMNSFTKKLLPSLRLGYVLGNAETTPSLVLSKRVSTSGTPSLVEAALFEFLDRGYYDAHLRKLQIELDARYRNCLESLRAQMPDPVQWTSPGGGPVLWLDLPREIDLDRLRARCEARGILIQTFTDAFFGAPHLHGFKIGYAFLDAGEMTRAIGIVAEEIRRAPAVSLRSRVIAQQPC